MPRRVESLVRTVLAQRTKHDAVLDFQSANLERGEELGGRLVVWLRHHCGSGGWFLRGGKIRNTLCGVIEQFAAVPLSSRGAVSLGADNAESHVEFAIEDGMMQARAV